MTTCDVAVIGAGIHGAAIARAAAGRGQRVVVIEQYDAAGLGTSSKSSKLIHGGLRYLESGQLRLVRACLRERGRLLHEYPDLVKLVPFFIPVYAHTRRSPTLIATGLRLYRLLGGKGFRRLPRREWPQLDGLQPKALKAVFRYWDAQTDDRLLSARVMLQAQQLGAETRYRTRFCGADCEPGGCRISVADAGGTTAITSRYLVNASGPWANLTLAKLRPAATPLAVELVQGTHILVQGAPSHGVYYLEAPSDGRAVFVMPWQGRTLIGTTETAYHGDPAAAAPTAQEVEYLLDTRNHYFDPPLPRSAVIDSFAGLRVLPAGDGLPFARSRDTLVHRDPQLPNVVTVYGGKLTSHRHTAQRVIERLGL